VEEKGRKGNKEIADRELISSCIFRCCQTLFPGRERKEGESKEGEKEGAGNGFQVSRRTNLDAVPLLPHEGGKKKRKEGS